MILLMIDTEYDLKITFRILKPENHQVINENPQNVVIFKSDFSII